MYARIGASSRRRGAAKSPLRSTSRWNVDLLVNSIRAIDG